MSHYYRWDVENKRCRVEFNLYLYVNENDKIPQTKFNIG